MGVDYYGYAVLGVRVPNTMVKKKVRGCRHQQVETSKFCSECGAQMWTESEDRHPTLEALENNGYKNIVWSTDQENAFVGVCVESDTNRRGGGSKRIDFSEDFEVASLKKSLKEILKELYQEKEFGLWSVLHCSY